MQKNHLKNVQRIIQALFDYHFMRAKTSRFFHQEKYFGNVEIDKYYIALNIK